MKKYLHIALMLLCVFVVSSCKDDDDDTEQHQCTARKLELFLFVIKGWHFVVLSFFILLKRPLHSLYGV